MTDFGKLEVEKELEVEAKDGEDPEKAGAENPRAMQIFENSIKTELRVELG